MDENEVIELLIKILDPYYDPEIDPSSEEQQWSGEVDRCAKTIEDNEDLLSVLQSRLFKLQK